MSSEAAEQNTPPVEEMTEEQKRAWTEWEANVRLYTKIQLEESQKLKADAESKQLGSMSDRELREWTMRHCKFDPGI